MKTFNNTPKYKIKDVVLISIAIVTILATIVYNLGDIL
jgi:hypothetical protein